MNSAQVAIEPVFDWSLRGRKNLGLGWKHRVVVNLNLAWREGAAIIISVELHEMLHALLHKLGLYGKSKVGERVVGRKRLLYKEETIIRRLEHRVAFALIDAYGDYLHLWAQIQQEHGIKLDQPSITIEGRADLSDVQKRFALIHAL